MSEPSSQQASWRRWLVPGLLLLFLATAASLVRLTPLASYIDLEQLYTLLQRVQHHPAAPVGLLALWIVLGTLGAPVTPFMVAGGAVFGTVLGSAISYCGALVSSSLTFALARTLARRQFAQLLGSRRRRLERALRENAFWAIVRLRFVPIPFPIMNSCAAVVGVPYRVFIAATAVAYVPIMLIWSFFSSSLVSTTSDDRLAVLRDLTVATLLVVTLTFVPPRVVALRRRQRYKRLIAARALRQRPAQAPSGASD